MPKAAPKPTAPAPRRAPAAVKPPASRPIRFERIEVNGVPIPAEKMRLTMAQAKKMMGWEAEDEYIARKIKEDPGLTLKTDTLRYGSVFMLTDEYGQKVRCYNNMTNRQFREPDARKYGQTVLKRQWAGPSTMPNETVNGETIIIGRHGSALSAQHRLCGFILACQMWHKDPYWRKYWAEEPFLESLVVTGVSEDPRVVQTLDNVVPRILSDTLVTTGVLDDWTLDGKPLTAPKRQEAGNLLDASIDLLWRRSGAYLDPHNKYQTHQASRDLMERHPSLKAAVKHIFEENQRRALSMMKLNPGHAAAFMYLMAAGETDGAAYRKGDPPSEKLVSLSRWEKAQEFWSLLAGGDKSLAAVKSTLAAVVNGTYGGLEMNDKKWAVVIKAWNEFLSGKKGAVTEKNITPDVGKNSSGELVLVPGKGDVWPNVEGIDMGHMPEPDEEELTPEQVEANTRAEKDRQAADLASKAGHKAANESERTAREALSAQLAGLRKEHPGHMLLFKNASGIYSSWEQDAEIVVKLLGVKMAKHATGIDRCYIDAKTVDESVKKLTDLGNNVVLLDVDGKTVVKKYKTGSVPGPAASTAKPAPSANGKPKPAAAKPSGPKLRPGNSNS